MRAGFIIFITALIVFSLASCDCGDPSTSSGQAQADDDDDTADDTADDADDTADDSGDDTGDDTGDDDTFYPELCRDETVTHPDCPEGFVSPLGWCVTMAVGEAPGLDGTSSAVGPDGTFYVAAVKGRDLMIYSQPPDGGPWAMEVAAHMAAGASLAVDRNGALHLSYFDLWDEGLMYATNACGAWTHHTVDSADRAGEESSIVIGLQNEPHIAYHIRGGSFGLKYAYWSADHWEDDLVYVNADASPGYYPSLALDKNGHAHIAHVDAYQLLFPLFYSTNESGSWETEVVTGGLNTYARLALDSNGKPYITFAKLDLYLGETRLKIAEKRPLFWDIQDLARHGAESSILIDAEDHIHIGVWTDEQDPPGLTYIHNETGVWQKDQIAEGTYFVDPSITTDQAGEIKISAFHSNEYKLYSFQQTDDGWANGIIDGGLIYPFYSSAVIDPDGVQHAAYAFEDDETLYLGDRQTGFWEFEPLAQVGSESEKVSMDMVFDSGGHQHFAYTGNLVGGVKYVKNEGSGWEDVYFDASGTGVRIALDKNEDVHLFYEKTPTGMIHAFQEGASWTTENMGQERFYYSFGFDSENNLHLLCHTRSPDDLCYSKKEADVWETRCFGIVNARHNAVAVTSEDIVHLFYYDNHQSDIYTLTSEDDFSEVKRVGDLSLGTLNLISALVDSNDVVQVYGVQSGELINFTQTSDDQWEESLIDKNTSSVRFMNSSINNSGQILLNENQGGEICIYSQL